MADCLRAALGGEENQSAEHVAEMLVELEREEARAKLPAMVLLALLLLLGLAGNALVCAVYGSRFPPSPARVFIVSLAVFDLLNCALALPAEIADLRYDYHFHLPVVCKLMRFSITLNTTGSASILLAIAVDRYKKICRPFGPQMSLRTAKHALMGAMLVAVGVSWPTLVLYGRSTRKLAGVDTFDCYLDDRVKDTYLPHIYLGFLALLCTVAATVLVVLYTLIVLKVWRQKKRRLKITSSVQSLRVLSSAAGSLQCLGSPASVMRSSQSSISGRAPAKRYSSITDVIKRLSGRYSSTDDVLTKDSFSQFNDGVTGDSDCVSGSISRRSSKFSFNEEARRSLGDTSLERRKTPLSSKSCSFSNEVFEGKAPEEAKINPGEAPMTGVVEARVSVSHSSVDSPTARNTFLSVDYAERDSPTEMSKLIPNPSLAAAFPRIKPKCPSFETNRDVPRIKESDRRGSHSLDETRIRSSMEGERTLSIAADSKHLRSTSTVGKQFLSPAPSFQIDDYSDSPVVWSLESDDTQWTQNLADIPDADVDADDISCSLEMASSCADSCADDAISVDAPSRSSSLRASVGSTDSASKRRRLFREAGKNSGGRRTLNFSSSTEGDDDRGNQLGVDSFAFGSSCSSSNKLTVPGATERRRLFRIRSREMQLRKELLEEKMKSKSIDELEMHTSAYQSLLTRSEKLRRKAGIGRSQSMRVEGPTRNPPVSRDLSINCEDMRKKAIACRNQSIKTTIMLFVVTLIFIVSFIPFFVLQTLKYILENFEETFQCNKPAIVAYKLFLRSFFINCVVNPLVYSFCNEKFREECRIFLCSLPCCRCSKKPQRKLSKRKSKRKDDHVDGDSRNIQPKLYAPLKAQE